MYTLVGMERSTSQLSWPSSPTTAALAGALLAAFLCTPVRLQADPGEGGSGPTLPPVAIEDPIPQTPVEAAGTGLAPTAQVVMHISPRGAIAKVDVAQMKLSAKLEAAYTRSLVTTLRRWRFAPALKNGRPVASTLEWQVEFLPAKDRDSLQGGLDAGFGLEPGPLLDPETAHRQRLFRVYTLPIEQQRRHLNELAATAERMLNVRRRSTAELPLVAVVTDHPDGVRAARALAANAQTTLAVLQQTLCEGLPVEPPLFRVRIYVYSKRDQYERFIDAVDGIRETSGMFIPPGLVVFHAELPSNEDVLSVLIHETVHAFVARYLLRPGVVLPRWLAEGLADYFSNSPVENHRLRPGKRRRTQFYRAPMRVWRGKTRAQLDLTTAWRKVARGKGFPVSALLHAERDAFYGKRMAEYYAQSWLLVHFLRQGVPGWTDHEFPRFLLYAAEGYDPEVVIENVYGMTAEEIEPLYRQHIKRF